MMFTGAGRYAALIGSLPPPPVIAGRAFCRLTAAHRSLCFALSRSPSSRPVNSSSATRASSDRDGEVTAVVRPKLWLCVELVVGASSCWVGSCGAVFVLPQGNWI